MTVTTGMLIAGKMSMGMEVIDTTPRTAINSASTTKVYGRRRARRTIHIRQRCSIVESGAASVLILAFGRPGRGEQCTLGSSSLVGSSLKVGESTLRGCPGYGGDADTGDFRGSRTRPK